MRAGQMRHRVTVLQRSTSQGSSGEQSNAWSMYAIRWAAIEPLSGREFFSAQQREARVTTQFGMRPLPGLKTAMRLQTDDGKLYNIVAVLPQGVGLNSEITIFADELVEEESS